MFLLLHLATTFVVWLSRKFWEEQTQILVGSYLSSFPFDNALYYNRAVLTSQWELCDRTTFHIRMGMKVKTLPGCYGVLYPMAV